jgi:serine/threonine-protein kinase
VQFCIADAAKLLIVSGPDQDTFLDQVIGGKYRVEKKLGEGGMGKIYLARHVTLGKRFAIKTLHPDFTRNQEALERFRREAITTAQLEHPNILGMSDMDQMDDGTAYIVMEFLDGKELRGALNDTPVLPLPRAVHIFSQVCRALAAAHDKGIVHRDMKPENVFLVEREGDPDFVKVLDFGISKIRQAGSKLTQTGMVIGTPHYMSPEQARGDPNLDHRSDIYTIGAMLYEALTGALPVQADNPTGVLVKILTETPPLPSAVNPAVPPPVEQVILQAMAKDPNARFGSCRDLSKALQQASGIMDGSTAYLAAAAAASTGMAAGRPPTGMVPGMPVPPSGLRPPSGMRPPTGQRPPGVPPTAVTPGGGMMQPPYPGAPPSVGPTAGHMQPGMPGMPTPGAGYPGAPPMVPGTGQAPQTYATGPTPMAWQQQASTGTAAAPAKKGSMLPLFIVLFLVLAGGAGTLVYFLVLRDDGSSKGSTTAAPASADAGIVKASADAGGPLTPDGGTTVATADTATGADAGTTAVEPETTVATGPDAGPDAGPDGTTVAVGPDTGPDVAPDTAPELVKITFITTPQGAKVFLVKADGTEEELCETACQYDFPKSDTDVQVVFRRSGHRDQPATFRANDEGGMVNMPLERIRSGQRDAGAREAVALEVTAAPDAGPTRRDTAVIVVPSRDAGPVIRIEAGTGVRQLDTGVRLRDTPFGGRPR